MCRPKTAICILAGLVFITPVLRWEASSWNLPWLDPNYSSPLQLSSIAAGALLAFLVTSDVSVPVAAAVLAGGGLFILSFALRIWPAVQAALADSLRSAAFGLAMFVILQVRSSNPVYKILNSKPFVAIGVLSYSLYLWQQPFAGILVPARYGIPLLALVATMSYRFVERPFLTLKDSIPKD
jgi:peptidoglycan/LPS O-acetylase OafA/YrhL